MTCSCSRPKARWRRSSPAPDFEKLLINTDESGVDGGQEEGESTLIRESNRMVAATLSLVKNSKTPVAISTTLMQRLTESDVKRLTTDRNVPEVLRLSAKKRLSSSQH